MRGRLARERREEYREARSLLGRLTRREKAVLQAPARGLNDKEISAYLYVSPGTVRQLYSQHPRQARIDLASTGNSVRGHYGAVEIGVPQETDSDDRLNHS